MRLVFAGTPAVAIPALSALHAADHEIATVITRADAPLGRKRTMTPSAVAVRAGELGIPVLKANRLDDAVTDEVAGLRPDLGVVVAYGGLVRERLLAVPRLGWINLHFSVLPRWRGAAPVQRALLAGEAVTGASVFRLVRELDAGDVYATLTRPIGADETAGELLAALADDGAQLLARVVDELAAGTARAVPQRGEPTTAPKITIDDARLVWTEPAERVSGRLRAVTPEPGAFTAVGGTRLKVLDARVAPDAAPLPAGLIHRAGDDVLVGTATHPLRLITVQPAGKRAMPAAAWWRGLGPRATADGGVPVDDAGASPARSTADGRAAARGDDEPSSPAEPRTDQDDEHGADR